MAFKTFANGFPLPASDLNNFFMKQSVIVFADVAARSAALPEPVEGMVTYLEDDNELYKWTGADWVNINDNSDAIPLSTVTTAGDLIIADGASSVTRLGIGSEDQVLSVVSGEPSWVTAESGIPATIFDAEGDLLYATAADTPARLPIGTNGQVLTSTGTTVNWEDLSAGGITLLASQSLSGLANFNFTSIDQTYRTLRLVVVGISALVDSYPSMGVGFNFHTFIGSYSANTTVNTLARTVTNVQLDPWGLDGNNANNYFVVEYENYASTSQHKGFLWYGAGQNVSNQRASFLFGGSFQTNTAITSINVSNTTTFTSGTAYLYGIK
jgi:hypothetical protein